MSRLLWLALFGAMGTLARYLVSGAVYAMNGTSFPWGTLVVNLTGSFLAGLLWSWVDLRLAAFPDLRTYAMLGFLGAFTTFSTFMVESGEMLRGGEWGGFILNLSLHNVLGLVALLVGAMLGSLVS